MNIYHILNEVILYIENHLEEKISYRKIAKMVGLNEQTLQNIFSLVTNIGLAEYIRNRRLSNAALDLQNKVSVMDVAMKYQYTSAIAFSRAFFKFHGVKPSEVKKEKGKLKNFPIFNFNEDNLNMSYRMEKKEKLVLYGVKKETTEEDISRDAPKFFKAIQKKYKNEYGNISYGMVKYEKRFSSTNLEYWCLYPIFHEGLLEMEIPASKWLIFKCNSSKAIDIQYLSHKFYNDFLPKKEYTLKDLPELEYYLEDGTMEFMIAIE